ncbi:hypothetical protein PSA5_05665 [Pseudomonas syringae pv. actinidiae]|nr:hypothetical protein PSA5_05665 [Pseudomonas syringae pv. actinidiae]
MKNEIKKTSLSLGNSAFKNREYESAVIYYKKALEERPELASVIDLNLIIGQKRLGKSRSAGDQQLTISQKDSLIHNISNEQYLEESVYPEYDIHASEEYKTISESGLFSHAYYNKNYLDIASSGIDPIEHYCTYGWLENRNPNASFNTHYYLGKNPDVAKSGMNPFSHWINYGRYELRKVNVIEVDPEIISSSNQPSIIFVSHEASQTGAPAVLISLMRWIKSNTTINFSVVIGAQGVWNSRFEDIAPCFYLDGTHKNGLTNELRDFCGSNVQAVYVNTIASGLYAEHLKYLGAEFITHVHEMENVFKIFEPNFSALKKICNRFIAVSQGSIDAIQKRTSADAEIFFFKPFIDPKSIYNQNLRKPTNKKIIFGCGAVEKRKGFDIFCDVAVELLSKGFENFKMYWIGSAENKDLDPDNEIKKRNLGQYVEWLGTKETPRDYFVWGDVFLLPSREDPYPLVCMEAAESGMPVICFDEKAGGMHSFVEKDAGFVVSYLDVSSMAANIVKILNNDTLKKKLGTRAREKVLERHYVDNVAPVILELLPTSIYQTGTQLDLYKKMIDDARIVSFDIFDTLITRQVNEPNIVFDLIEYNYTMNESSSLPLLKERMDSAGRVLGSHQGRVDDISIDSIYQEMTFFNNSNIEKQAEIDVCVPHKLGAELYAYAKSKNKTIYIASDMYLDQKTIESILTGCGYTRWDQLFLSSALGKKKDTGKLYSALLEHPKTAGVPAHAILHIGDNWEGDVRQAKRAGLVTKRFSPINENSLGFFTLSLEKKNQLSQKGRIWNSFCEQQTNLWHHDAPTVASDFYTKLGFELTGPLASMMAIYVKKQADKAGVKNIIFMARDGRIIKKAFDLLYSADINEGRYISSYLHLSRATVVPATLEHPLSSSDISFIIDGLHLAEKNIGYFLKKAGLDIKNKLTVRICKKYFKSLDLTPQWDDLKLLSDMFRELSEQVYTSHSKHRTEFSNYLIQHGVVAHEKSMLVDVGWLLNIQSRLEKFIHRMDSRTQILGCYVGSRDRVNKNLEHSAFLFEQGDPFTYANFIEENTTLFEILFSAPEPSAKGLKIDSITNRCTAEFKLLDMPLSKEFVVAQKIQMGAEAFFERFKKARCTFFPEIISRDYFFYIFESLVKAEHDIAKATLGNFEISLGGHHEFVVNHELVKNDNPHLDYQLKPREEYFEPAVRNAKQSQLSILIVTSSGLNNGSTRYRALHLADSLSRQGICSTIIHASENDLSAEALITQADTVLFQRCFPAQGNVGTFFETARRQGKHCLAEIDDLVFPEYVSTIGSVAGGEWDLSEAMYVATSYEDFIKKMDAALSLRRY